MQTVAMPLTTRLSGLPPTKKLRLGVNCGISQPSSAKGTFVQSKGCNDF